MAISRGDPPKQTQTDKQTDRQTERQKDRKTERQKDRKTDRQTDIQTDIQTDRQTEISQPASQPDRQTDRLTDMGLAQDRCPGGWVPKKPDLWRSGYEPSSPLEMADLGSCFGILDTLPCWTMFGACSPLRIAYFGVTSNKCNFGSDLAKISWWMARQNTRSEEVRF